ncbi:MAG: amidase, partial [Pseudomonadota bacterium]
RNRLKLLSCPELIRRDDTARHWSFEGIGKGHGTGLSVARARMLSRSGYDAVKILEDAYGRD